MRLHPNQLLNHATRQRLARAVDGFEGHLRPHRNRIGLEARSKRHEQDSALNGEVAPFRHKNWRREFAFGLPAVFVSRQVEPRLLRDARAVRAYAVFVAPNVLDQLKPTLSTLSIVNVARSREVIARLCNREYWSTPECMVRA